MPLNSSETGDSTAISRWIASRPPNAIIREKSRRRAAGALSAIGALGIVGSGCRKTRAQQLYCAERAWFQPVNRTLGTRQYLPLPARIPEAGDVLGGRGRRPRFAERRTITG